MCVGGGGEGGGIVWAALLSITGLQTPPKLGSRSEARKSNPRVWLVG